MILLSVLTPQISLALTISLPLPDLLGRLDSSGSGAVIDFGTRFQEVVDLRIDLRGVAYSGVVECNAESRVGCNFDTHYGLQLRGRTRHPSYGSGGFFR